MTTILYILSVVAANLFTSTFGPKASIISAFVMIGATMTLRDKLHEEWRENNLVLKMGGVIVFAGAISALLSAGAATRIAIASVIAFIASETVDAFSYHLLRRHPWLVRSNGSNIPSSAVDSILFPTIAFGGLMPLITLGQFAAKIFGGAIWAFLIKRGGWVAAVILLCAAPSNAQSISINGAWIHNPYVSAAAGEIFVSAPPVYSIRPYTIVSWNTSAGAEPTVLARLGYSKFFGKFMAGAGAGMIRLPGDKFRPSLSVIAFGPRYQSFKPYVLVAYEKTPEWTWTTFVGINLSLYFRK